MNLTSPYLTPKGGYTSSKANFYANIIKQISQTTDSTLTSHVLIERVLDKNGVPLPYNQVTPALSIDKIVELATTEGKYYAVSAWLREGIKAKEALLANVRFATPEVFGFELPSIATYMIGVENPINVVIPGEDDVDLVMDKLSIAERAEYLSLEAQAAHIGKRIHNKLGLFNQWRKLAVDFKPLDMLTPTPGQVFVISNTLRLSVENIDTILLRLQGEHRDLESKLNSYKARLKTAVQELIQEAQSKRALYEVAYRAANEKFASDYRTVLANTEVERSKAIVTVSKLGIIIPKMHEAILAEVAEKIKYQDTDATNNEVE